MATFGQTRELTFESGAALLIILHDNTDDESTVILSVEGSCLEHDAKTMYQCHHTHARLISPCLVSPTVGWREREKKGLLTYLERRLLHIRRRTPINLIRIVSRHSLLESSRHFLIQLRQEHLDHKVFQDGGKPLGLAFETWGHDRRCAMDECQGGLEKGGDVECVGGDEGAVPPRGWGKAVVGIGSDDGNGLVGLHVDETGDR